MVSFRVAAALALALFGDAVATSHKQPEVENAEVSLVAKSNHKVSANVYRALAYRRSLVAQNAQEAEASRARQASIFAKGRQLRARKALYQKHLAACNGEKLCQREVKFEQLKIERLVAAGKATEEQINGIDDEEHEMVSDSIGRRMPLLFSGKGSDEPAPPRKHSLGLLSTMTALFSTP
eukprot:TRINITY_DN2477_c0_g2_i1.p1 TRINITY_DN2477_c0_g2~~TRINITY_DN2477_c0_g2_i1.p1  ORF type:complete len:180 (-),score=44.57 TRINITY_DN2477_c0_g2_i1:320-859(-)